MSRAGGYFKTGISIVNQLSGEKPHSSITDWVEVLTSDRYEELSLDGIPELVESVNLQGYQGTEEAARAIRKKLKYGNVHRQLRALVILRALTENAGKGFHVNWANAQLMERLRIMAQDNLLDPKVKKRLILVFHAWSIQYADEPRMQAVAGLFRQYSGGASGHARKPSGVPAASASAKDSASPTHSRGFSETDNIYQHSWEPAAGHRGADTYTDLAAAKEDAQQRKRERESRMALERREAEIERRERELRRKQEMEAVEARRRREAQEESERRRKAKEQRKQPQPKRPKFNFEKEKPGIMTAVATAIQAASNLVNSVRLVNRETENVIESPRVQDNLDKAKAARRAVIRYVQLVTDEEYVGMLLDANEKIVEAIQLYDKLSKPAALDSDSEHEQEKAPNPALAYEPDQVEAIRKRLEAQKLEANRTGELQALQDRQKKESERRQVKQRRQGTGPSDPYADLHADLEDLDFGSNTKNLPPPMRPDSEAGSYDGGSLSDFSDYDSSEEEYRAAHSRRQSYNPGYQKYGSSSGGGLGGHPDTSAYRSLDLDGGSSGLLDPNDPFGDPFGDDNETTPQTEKPRMEWAEI